VYETYLLFADQSPVGSLEMGTNQCVVFCAVFVTGYEGSRTACEHIVTVVSEIGYLHEA
jgi:hypothetical protein